MNYQADHYDCIVVGTGHAGCEAALATARLGCRTVIFTLNLDNIALMPCNPSLGGPAKGNLVREIDALGGEMGRNIDETYLQMKMLNTGKGPAVYGLRAQADKKAYQKRMTFVLQHQENLDVKQALVDKLLVGENKEVQGIVTETGAIYTAPLVILCTGTYLKGKVFIGNLSYTSGPNGQRVAEKLVDSLEELGLEVGRFKTGTPPRVDKNSLDYEETQIQYGEEEAVFFSYLTEKGSGLNVPSHLTYTNEETHQILQENLSDSPLYSGAIQGTGPRYCPAIEVKIVRFPEKERHQVFLEPEGLNTSEIYVLGMSSSMPENIQLECLHTIEGMKRAQLMRPGYAIEYNYLPPTQLKPSLETKAISGLFCAGQINGTSGYEEAAAQGLLAGINAVQKFKQQEPLILKRSEAYIGVLIDDLVTKGTNEPYRMLTSRAEYRLLLRHDNADLRLTPKGWEIGLVTPERYTRFLQKKVKLEAAFSQLQKNTVSATTENMSEMLSDKGSADLRQGITLYDLLKRPEIKYDDLVQYGLAEKLEREISRMIDIHIKYEGYIKKQLAQVARFNKLENKRLPQDLDYLQLQGLSVEACQKLKEIKPLSLGQASRISGVSPADITALMICLEKRRRS